MQSRMRLFQWTVMLGLASTRSAMALLARSWPERTIMLLDTGDGSHMELFAPTADSPAPC